MLLLLPTIQLWLSLAVLGTEPTDFKIGVVNEEIPNFAKECSLHKNINNSSSALETGSLCDLQFISCNLISELSRTGLVEAVSIF